MAKNALWPLLSQDLETLKRRDLYRSLEPRPARSDKVLDFSSNDYLGLSTHPHVIARAVAASKKWGTGSGASRLLSGNQGIHEELEKKIAAFKKEEAALIFSSGYLANLGALTALAGEKDLILLDRLNHASLVDAARLSKAKLWVYPHRDVEALDALLIRAGRAFKRCFIVTDAYFSMDGDVAPLDLLYDVSRRHGALLYVDEAHSTGVFGRTGRGLSEMFGLSGQIDVVMGTMSKALGSVGGFIAGDKALRETLINRAKPFIYTTGPSPMASAAALGALEMIEDDLSFHKKLWKNIKHIRKNLINTGFDLLDSEGPIIPVVIGNSAKTMQIKESLRRKGILVGAVRPPTVPKGTDRLRLSVSARHSQSDLDRLTKSLKTLKGRTK